MVQLPKVQALVLADHIYRDPNSGKLSILGIFNRLITRGLPKTFERTTFAYVCLTDLLGTVEVELRYRDLRTNEVLMQTVPLSVRSDDPLLSIEMVIEVAPFPMPHAGVYTFEVHTRNEMLGSLRVLVESVEQGAK